jgi:hypothetical protein
MTRSAYLEKNSVLPLEENFPVVERARQVHNSKCSNEGIAIELDGQTKRRFRRN